MRRSLRRADMQSRWAPKPGNMAGERGPSASSGRPLGFAGGWFFGVRRPRERLHRKLSKIFVPERYSPGYASSQERASAVGPVLRWAALGCRRAPPCMALRALVKRRAEASLSSDKLHVLCSPQGADGRAGRDGGKPRNDTGAIGIATRRSIRRRQGDPIMVVRSRIIERIR